MGDNNKFFTIKRVGDGSRKKSEKDIGKTMKKAGKPELYGRTGDLVDLIKLRHLSDLRRYGGQGAGKP